MSKFQNMIISLIGMFYRESEKIKDVTKMEALKLLQDSGIKDRNDWLDILNAVKCDEFVASFISKQEKILEGIVEITDSSLFAYISLMQALRAPLECADKVIIVINIKGDISDAGELLNQISVHQFKVKSILMTDKNFMKYTSLLKTLQVPLKSEHKVSVYLEIERHIASIDDFMMQVSSHQFKVRKILINDNNLINYVSVLRSMPPPLKDVRDVTIEICIKEETSDITELMNLINVNKFNVTALQAKKIVVTDDNMNMYTSVLKFLEPLLKDPNDVNLEISIQEEKSDISDFLSQINNTKVSVKTLQVKKMLITDDTHLNAYTSVLASLPTPSENTCNGNIYMRMNEETPNIKEFLNEISRNRFEVPEMYLRHNFQHPTANQTMEDAINSVFTRCNVNTYMGSITPGMTIFKTIRNLYVGLANTTCYSRLHLFFQSKPKLELLYVCASPHLIDLVLQPLPTPKTNLGENPPSLYIPDVTEKDLRNVTQIIARLQPTDGYQMFREIFFPRAALTHQGIKDLLQGMSGVRVWRYAVFPSNCRPSDPHVEEEINELAKTILRCSDGVEWGLFGIDDW